MPERPFALMIAGPNGSGKSTLTNRLREQGLDFGEYINPDEIAATLDGSYVDRVARAQAIADASRDEFLDRGRSFSFEVRGFRTALYFVATESPDLNVDRVRQRVELGGHDVPEDRIRARYARTLNLLPAAMGHAEDIALYDNSHRAVRLFFLARNGVVRLAPPLPTWSRRALELFGRP